MIGKQTLTVAAALVAALVLSVLPGRVWAAVDCNAVLAAGETGVDSDNDGFTDFQECSGITLVGGTLVVLPPCGPSSVRTTCVDPNTKDLFVIYAPAAPSLLPATFNPFGTVSAYGVTFTGLSNLGVTVHQITPLQAGTDRTVTSVSTEKAVRVAESLDTNGTILGNCQWGTPLGLDGCVIYTQRIMNFIASTCGTNAIVTPSGVASNANDVFLAYAVHTFLHETGHTTGGMTATYNSSYGGNHYKCGAGTMMEQCVTYSTKGGKCSFNISGGWNTTTNPTDQSTIKLK
jgi:hypothetical protein